MQQFAAAVAAAAACGPWSVWVRSEARPGPAPDRRRRRSVRHKSASLPGVAVKHCGSRALRRPTGIQLRTAAAPAIAARPVGAPVGEDSGRPKLMRPSKEAAVSATSSRLSIREHRERARLVFGDRTFLRQQPSH